jgi:hypothetical protein
MMAYTEIPRRDASAVIRGFVFQVNLTILRWIELQLTAVWSWNTEKTSIPFRTDRWRVPRPKRDSWSN